MVYLPELLVVMTDGLKIVRIRARNVLRTDGQKRLDDDASLTQESDGLVCSRSIYNLWLWCARCAGAPSCWNTKKIVSGQYVHVWQWPLRKKVVATVCPLHFGTKSEQSDCNKSSVK